MEDKFFSRSVQETQQIAKKIAKKYLQRYRIFTLSGELGSGKTVFVQGFVKHLNIKDKIVSPTFILIREHKIPKSEKILFHIDLYRLENTENIGLKEIFQNKNTIVLVEWPEKIDMQFLGDVVKIYFTKISETKRKVQVTV